MNSRGFRIAVSHTSHLANKEDTLEYMEQVRHGIEGCEAYREVAPRPALLGQPSVQASSVQTHSFGDRNELLAIEHAIGIAVVPSTGDWDKQ